MPLPEKFISGSTVKNLPTVMLPAAEFGRLVTAIDVGNSTISVATVHKGSLDGLPFERTSNGQGDTLSCRLYLPPGVPLFVRWQRAGANARDAFARFRYEESEHVPDASYGWSYQAIDLGQSKFYDIPFFNTTITQQTILGPYPTGHMDSVGIRCFALTGHGQLVIQWFNDEALQFFITNDVISLREDSTWDQSVIVKGPFMRIIADNVEPADWELTLILYEATRSVIPQDGATRNILISQFAQVVGAGATVTWTANTIIAGEAVWNIRTNGTAFAVTLTAVDHNTVNTQIDSYIQTDVNRNRTTFLPSQRMQITYTNSDAVDRTVSAFLVAKPGLSGF